jgi:hypothetical protein
MLDLERYFNSKTKPTPTDKNTLHDRFTEKDIYQ